MSTEFHPKSNNPFRRTGGQPPHHAPPALHLRPVAPSGASFFDDDIPINPSTASTPSTDDASTKAPAKTKTKPVKHVRLQTPPPRSPDTEPDTPTFIDRAVQDQLRLDADPFQSADGVLNEDDDDDDEPPARPGAAPRNPFSRTLHDLENKHTRTGPAPKANTSPSATPGKAALDVAAFSRLLLTGQPADTPPASRDNAVPERSFASSTSRKQDAVLDSPPFIRPQHSHHSVDITTEPASSETPRTSLELDREERSVLKPSEPVPLPAKKKPPPPSSRHGKLIKIELGGNTLSAERPLLARSPSDPNKPLPPAPARRPGDDDPESIFDREAAGKIPETSEPSSPVAIHEAPATPSSRKHIPAPPPRRPRPESIIQERHGGGSTIAASIHTMPELRRKSSAESTRSRAESVRSLAPAPPPPRRPALGHRSTNSITSPSTPSFTSTSLSTPHIAMLDTSHHHHYPTSPQATTPSHPPSHAAPSSISPKFAPPPPPTRNASTRRQSSTSSIETVTKRASFVPPPPPRRNRGSSRDSMELTPGNARRSSLDKEKAVHGPHAAVPTLREVDEASGGSESATAVAAPRTSSPDVVPVDNGQAGAILADLDALQREVEELQRQFAAAQGNK